MIDRACGHPNSGSETAKKFYDPLASGLRDHRILRLTANKALYTRSTNAHKDRGLHPLDGGGLFFLPARIYATMRRFLTSDYVLGLPSPTRFSRFALIYYSSIVTQ